MTPEDVLTLTTEPEPQARRRVGRVIANTGAVVLVMIEHQPGETETLRTGDMLIVGRNASPCVGAVTSMSVPAPGAEGDPSELWVAEVELYGAMPEEGAIRRGLPRPPALGDPACLAGGDDLEILYGPKTAGAVTVGTVAGTQIASGLDPAALAGGFAILGAPGSGKSCTLAVLVRALLRARHPVRPVLLDVGDEYARSFGKAARVIRPGPGFLPHWLLKMDELAFVLGLNGGPLHEEERALLDEAVPYARRRTLQRAGHDEVGATPVDGPLPYRVNDLLSWIDRTAQQDGLRGPAIYERLRTRLRSVSADERLAVVFGGPPGLDTLSSFVQDVFCLRRPGPLMSVLQLGKLPLGLDRLVAGVVARIGAAIAEGSDGALPVLLLMEEAERFVPAEAESGACAVSAGVFGRLARRSARSGLGLGLVSDRPTALSARLLREAPTFFVHRMPSEADRARVTAALPETANAFTAAAASLRRGEAVVSGDAVPVPGRLVLDTLPDAAVPRSGWPGVGAGMPEDFVENLIRRWRFGSELRPSTELPPRAQQARRRGAISAA